MTRRESLSPFKKGVFELDPILTDELKHYGVKGMKWGVRKDRDGGSNRRRSKRQPAEEAKATLKKRKRATSAAERLSNQELQKRIQRLELEKKYTNLTENKREGILVKTGGRVAKDLLYEVSKDLAKDMVVSAIKRK